MNQKYNILHIIGDLLLNLFGNQSGTIEVGTGPIEIGVKPLFCF